MRNVFVAGALLLALGLSPAQAQSQVGEVFCGLYKSAFENGPTVFQQIRGKEVSSGVWRIKDVAFDGGRCLIRTGTEGDFITCTMKGQSSEQAKLWARDMISETRQCVTGITKFTEKSVTNSASKTQIERTSWTRRNGGSTMRISIINATKPGGASQSRMEVRYQAS